MKYITTFFLFVLTLVAVVYVSLFTPVGNDIAKPFLEKEIVKVIKVDAKLEIFRLGFSTASIVLVLNKNNTIRLKANYSLLAKSFNSVYRINFQDLSKLQALTQKPLQGTLKTEGSAIGKIDKFRVKGMSSVASSDTHYDIVVSKLALTSIKAKISSLKLKKLLYMLKEKSYADAKINMEINFKNITPHQLDGIVTLHTSQGYFNRAVMKKDFNITIPKKTKISMKLDAKLKGDNVDYIYTLESNLAHISSGGRVTPEPLNLKLAYSVDVKELALLKALSGVDMRGPLKLNGKIEGTKKSLELLAKTDFAASHTVVALNLVDFKPKNIQVKIKSLQIQKALYALQLAPYSDGLLDMQIAIKNANIGRLDGLVKTEISHGKLNTNYLTKEMQFSSVMPKTTYSLNVITKLKGANEISAVNLYSNLLELHTKETKFNLTDKSLKSDYSLNIKNLDKLYFITERHLKGAVLARGDISKAKDLDVSIYSDIADGKLSITLHNDDLKAKLKGAKTLEILDMTLYPKLFDARINADVAYNLAVKKGTIDAKLLSGTFTKNQPLDLVKKYGKVDMYAEKFDGDLKAKIEQEKLIGSLFLKSNHSSIETKNAILNTKRKTVNSKIDINANGNPVKVTLKGDINHPKVSINADTLLKRKAAKVIHKEVNKFLKRFF